MSGERNSKFTEPRIEAALSALRAGCTRQAASGAAGVSRVTFWRWMDDVTFRNEVEKAEDYAEATFTAFVAAATITNWTAAAWWLERRRPDHYARRERIDLNVDLSGEVRKLAQERGLDESVILAEAEAILAGRR